MMCVRENTEGEYAGIGGRVHRGLPAEVAIQTDVFTRTGVERIVRYAFELATRRRGRLASITKSNAGRHAFTFWDDVVALVAPDYPSVSVDRVLVDAAAAYFVTRPEMFDVVVGSNLFMDVLTDIGAVIQGGMGLAASMNVNPDGGVPAMFEPVHGSAPDIAGQGIANPDRRGLGGRDDARASRRARRGERSDVVAARRPGRGPDRNARFGGRRGHVGDDRGVGRGHPPRARGSVCPGLTVGQARPR